MADAARSPLVATLPEVFQDAVGQSRPLAALVAVADDLLDPVSQILDVLDRVVDPFRAPERMVGYLASWVDLGWLTIPDSTTGSRSSLAEGNGPLRDLMAASADLAARRGTPAGLVRFLTIATRVEGFKVEDVPGQFHVRVHLPPAAAPQLDTVERIVRTLKPAHVSADLVVDQDKPSGSTPSIEEATS
jgi:phage tail-like protein